jgi:hypothetical protein
MRGDKNYCKEINSVTNNSNKNNASVQSSLNLNLNKFNEMKDFQQTFSVIEEENYPDSFCIPNNDDSSTCLDTLKEILNGVSDSQEERIDNIIYYHKVNLDYEFEKRKGHNICEAFLITGVDVTSNDTQFLNETEAYSAACGHSSCGSLKAFKPRILYKFPHEKLEYLDISQTV